jgi:hypothetical protein
MEHDLCLDIASWNSYNKLKNTEPIAEAILPYQIEINEKKKPSINIDS